MYDVLKHFKRQPFRHQVEAFERAQGRKGFALLLEMGLAKSAVSLALLHERTCRPKDEGGVDACLILAPKSVCRTWVEEHIPQDLPDPGGFVVGLWSPLQTQKQLMVNQDMTRNNFVVPILVMNIDAIGTPRGYNFASLFMRSHESVFMIIDESTRIKNPRAIRTKRCLQLGLQATSRLILTGTPVTQSPLDIFTQYEFLGPGLLECSNYFSFKARYAQTQKQFIARRAGDKIIKQEYEAIVGYQRLDELQKLVLRHGYRKLKAECLDLPAKIYQVRRVELSEQQRELYKQMELNAVMELENEVFVTAPLALTKILRLRQLLAGFTSADPDEDDGRRVITEVPCPRIDELLAAIEETSGKVIIWTCFIPSIKRISRELRRVYGEQCVGEFYGGTHPEARQEIINSFQSPGGIRFFLGQEATGGIGINLTAARTVIYYDNDWSLEARAQSEDRAHRIGQTGTVTYVDLVASGTVDDDVVLALHEKRNLAAQVTGDWRRLLRKMS